MATVITNQAALTYQYGGTTGTAASNIATALLQGPLSAVKTSLSADYRPGEEITYSLAFANNGPTALTDITIVDDLGTYTIAGPVSVTPLTYIGPASLYVNGAFVSEITPVLGANDMTFTLSTLAANANALILYRVKINEYALLDTGAVLAVDTTLTAAGLAEPVFASHTLGTEDYADLRIIKTMSPNPVTDGGMLTYDFTVYNYGNMDATDMVLTDAFNPAPANINVTLNGDTVSSAEYDYTAGTLTLPKTDATLSITVSAAQFQQDGATGLISVSPGMADIRVSGRI